MEAEHDRIRPIKDALAHIQSYPPWPVLEAVVSLLGDTEHVAAIGTRDQRGSTQGRWRCAVLTSTHLLYVEAARAGEPDYDLGSHMQDATDLSAKSWRRDRVQRVEVRGVETRDRQYGTAHVWRVRYAVVMDDGSEILLPPDGGWPGGQYEGDVEAFVRELT